ncbi:MAG: hypothetical protein ABI543_11665 [Ignavibacteria bacterium]
MKMLIIFALLVFTSNNVFSQNGTESMTKWKIEPSFKYDLCCFLNILTGDEFYKPYYKDELNPYENKLIPAVNNAIKSLHKKLKDDNEIIISAWLSLYFSAIDGEELDDLIAALNDPGELKDNFSKTPYYDEESWGIFLSVKDELLVIFRFLKDNGFKEYWTDNIRTKIQKKIDEIQPGLAKYDVIKENEKMLGFKLPSDTITVYMLYYNKPHGIKITGMRFLTAIDWPFEITIRTSAHEMMHPPYDLKNDGELKGVIESFYKDDFVMDKVNNHNKSLGYNTLDGLFEEDCVQVMDQLINETLGISKDAKKRWQESDEGIHVVSVALYQIMKAEKYNSKNDKFSDFILRIYKEGTFNPGKIKGYYDKFYN